MKKFYTFLAAVAVSLSAAATDYYLIGGFNNWTLKDAKCLFTDKGDGTYVLDYAGSLTSGFKVNDGTWGNNDINFGSNGKKLVVGEAYAYGVGGSTGDIKMDGAVENPHLVLNPTAGTLTITGADAEVEIAYCIHGNLDGGEAWADYPMTENAGVWTANVTVTGAGAQFGIKETTNGAQSGWFAAAEDGYISADDNSTFAVTDEGGTNFDIEVGSYSLSFNPKALTLTVTSAAGIGNVNADASAVKVYYNVKGQQVSNPSGLMIVKQGNKVSKEYVK